MYLHVILLDRSQFSINSTTEPTEFHWLWKGPPTVSHTWPQSCSLNYLLSSPRPGLIEWKRPKMFEFCGCGGMLVLICSCAWWWEIKVRRDRVKKREWFMLFHFLRWLGAQVQIPMKGICVCISCSSDKLDNLAKKEFIIKMTCFGVPLKDCCSFFSLLWFCFPSTDKYQCIYMLFCWTILNLV